MNTIVGGAERALIGDDVFSITAKRMASRAPARDLMPDGLVLGAGASCEVGMPLVWPLTDELRTGIAYIDLRAVNERWASEGGGHPPELIDELYALFARRDVHYESILGYLETQQRRHENSHNLHQYGHLYDRLLEMVYHLIYARHFSGPVRSLVDVGKLRGLAQLAKTVKPLWVFSLNHDMIVEMVAAESGVRVRSGFSDEELTLPIRRDGSIVGHVRAELLRNEQLDQRFWGFHRQGEVGINLMKVHGGLEIFTIRDDRDFIRIKPDDETPLGILRPLRIVNEQLSPNPDWKVTNAVTYLDGQGDVQFLFRTLLSGSYKFEQGRQQPIPNRLLDWFSSYLNHVSTLAVVGYSFGDHHINSILRKWIESSSRRVMIIVSPAADAVPAPFLHVAQQVVLDRTPASAYFARFA